MIDELNSTFFFAVSQVQNTPNKQDGVLNAYLGNNDENCEGWMAGPSDGWYLGDPRRGQGFESNCPLIIFAAGTQFIAYKSSWQVALRDIPADYYELGFWGAIEKHLGLTELEFYAEFNALLRSVDANTISKNYAPPGWKIPDADIADVVDFPGICYYGKKTGAPSSIGDVCDYDDDGDGVLDINDAYPLISLGGLTDTDGDGRPDDCDSACLRRVWLQTPMTTLMATQTNTN